MIFRCNFGSCLSVCLFFFFKQKTAYEMRISDWSSDVCLPISSAWVGDTVWADGAVVGYLLAEIDISDIRARHTWLRWTMMVVDLLISLVCADRQSTRLNSSQ